MMHKELMKDFPEKFLAAMIAVMPLPGAPLYRGDRKQVIKQALEDLERYMAEGVDAIVLENSHDLPYIKPPLPEDAIKTMITIAEEVRRRFPGPIGIQMLEGANEIALEIAAQTGLNFLRVESYVFAHVGGAGLIEGCAGKLLRKRKQLQCEHIKVFADVKKKHCSHALTVDLDITDEVKQAEFFLVNGIIITGPRTGEEPKVEDLQKVKQVTQLPILIGSGITAQNINTYLRFADGFIVGSDFREAGSFLGKLEPQRLKHFMKVFKTARLQWKAH